jgi:hydrophobic/amphiphilic exporter-1 (mainly G- bacteria), HAE1 family
MTLTEIAIQRPSLILVLFAVLMSMGMASYFTLPIELVPKFSPPVATIITVYPGASPSEVENSVSRVLEDAVSSVEGIEELNVNSQENSSFIAVEFDQNTDLDAGVREMERRIGQALPNLPKGVRAPIVNKFALDELPVMRLAVSGNGTGSAFYDLVKNRLVPEITQVKGVGQVSVLGGEEREILVSVRADKLAQYNLSILQVTQAVQASNLDFPTGKVSGENNQTRIRLAGKFHSIAEIQQLIVGKSRFGGDIRLGEVAFITDGSKTPEVQCRTGGVPAIGLTIRKQGDANAVEMTKLVETRLKAIEADYKAEGVQFQIIANSSKFTQRATDSVMHDLVLAVILVSLVMLLFLHSLRNAMIVLIAIPCSIISTFAMMKVMGYSLNLLSLLGLSLAIGILVDDAIVVIENIYRHLEMGKDRVQASYDGRKEIGYTAISITLVDVVVFLPIILTSGMVPNLLRQFCMTMLTSTLLSLLVSFTLVPWLTSRIAKVHRVESNNLVGRIILGFERFMDWFADGFVSALKWALSSIWTRSFTVLGALGLFLASFLLVTKGYIGNSFFDPGERGEFLVEIELPKNATFAQTDAVARQVEELLKRDSHVVNTYTTVGTTNRSFGLTAPNIAEIFVFLDAYGKLRDTPTDQYARHCKIKLTEQVPGARIKTTPIDILGLTFAPIEVRLIGPDQDSLFELANRVKAIMQQVPGCVEIEKTVEAGAPELVVDVNRQRLADYGLNMAVMGMTLQTAFSGNTDGRFRDGSYEYPIRVQLDAFDRRSAKDLEHLTLINALNQPVQVRQVAEVKQSKAPTRLERRARQPSLMLMAQVIGRPNGSVSRDIKSRLDTLPLPKATTIQYGGDLKRQQQGIGTMAFAIWASILLIYLIMVALYDNWVYPFVVLFSIPLALIGAFLALALMRENLTVFTGIGLIVLIGLVGKNTILVVDFANQLQNKGTPLRDALLEATKTRFRPVLMTNIAMVIGLLPLAYAQGAGSDWKNGLAWAIIGGLNSSMFLSLIVVPVIYWMVVKLVGLGKGV